MLGRLLGRWERESGWYKDSWLIMGNEEQVHWKKWAARWTLSQEQEAGKHGSAGGSGQGVKWWEMEKHDKK